MKFWEKIFLYSVILTIVLINGVGIILIEKIYYSNMDRVISDSIEVQSNIINTIYLSSDTLPFNKSELNTELTDNFELILRNYIYNNTSNIKNIQMFDEDNNELVSINEKSGIKSRDLLSSINGFEKVFTIIKQNKENIVLVGSEFKLNDKNYKLVLSKNIDFLFNEKRSNYKLFIVLDVFINIFLVIGMYIISRYVTKPIVKLAEVSVRVSNGKYKERAEYLKSNDEVGILSRNFNDMLESLQEKREELEEINVEKQRFINNLTHEIKTPITSIIGYSDLLLKANINDEIRGKAISYINSEGRRLENLSSVLIRLTRLKNDSFQLENINLSDSIHQSIGILRENYEGKNINIKIDNKLNNPLILGENQLVIVLFKNIVENAIKASAKNSNILINMYSDNNESIVSIRDYGVGIPEEDLGKIMEPFYMVDKARDRSQNGIGLGLSLCSEICRLFNIKLSVNSKVNEGTEVILKFNNELGGITSWVQE